MQPSVLIIGGMGRIGRAVAQDLLIHTQADLTLTSRTAVPVYFNFEKHQAHC